MNPERDIEDILPGTILRFEKPGHITQEEAQALQALACGVTQRRAAELSGLTESQVGHLKRNHRRWLDIYKARVDLVFAAMLESVIYQGLHKITQAIVEVPPREARTLAYVLQVAVGMLRSLNTPAGQAMHTSQSARAASGADLTSAIEALKSKQDVDCEEVVTDAAGS